MQDMTGGMLAVFVGVISEQWAVERHIDVLQRTELADCPVTLGSIDRKAVLVCRTGLGRARGRAAVEAVLSEHSPSAIVSARMASSVPNEVRAGDIVLCEKAHVCLGVSVSLEPAPEADRRLLTLAEQAARAASLRYRRGDVLTYWRDSLDPKDQERENLLPEMTVVDAGGYAVAEAARENGLPFLAVRVALGRVMDVGPEAMRLVADRGYMRPARVALHYLPRPHKAPAFIRLALGVRRATGRLSAFMGHFLREWNLEP